MKVVKIFDKDIDLDEKSGACPDCECGKKTDKKEKDDKKEAKKKKNLKEDVEDETDPVDPVDDVDPDDTDPDLDDAEPEITGPVTIELDAEEVAVLQKILDTANGAAGDDDETIEGDAEEVDPTEEEIDPSESDTVELVGMEDLPDSSTSPDGYYD